jgi:hypothetical protein
MAHALQCMSTFTGMQASADAMPESIIWSGMPVIPGANVQGLCALFAPGNRHAVVGTKEGSIQVLDIGASQVSDTIAAHTAAVRTPPPPHPL